MSGLGAVLWSHHAGPHVEQSLLLREPDHLRHACQAPALGDGDGHVSGSGGPTRMPLVNDAPYGLPPPAKTSWTV